MKNKLLYLLITLTITLVCVTEYKSQTKLLHYWHFNDTLPTTGGGGTHFGTGNMNNDYTKLSVTSGYLRFVKVANRAMDTGYWDNFAGEFVKN